MKTRSKVLSLVLAGTLIVSAGMFGTLAYLTDTAEVTNNFTVGKVEITLDEADVKPDGTYVTDKNSRVTANDYKLMPGKTYIKDPVVHVADDSEDSYLFVKVKNEITDIEIEGETTVAKQMDNNGWTLVSGNIYVYVGEGSDPAVVEKGTNVPVFETFTIAGETTNDELDDYTGKTITVTAYAIQADGFEDKTAEDIWQAAGFDNTAATE